ncbi:hypothetical protein G6F59_018127 [Rhizopus arrhizus]|nr:hypothetical protein G6F59_018127 [Rhizopus arrhizus]
MGAGGHAAAGRGGVPRVWQRPGQAGGRAGGCGAGEGVAAGRRRSGRLRQAVGAAQPVPAPAAGLDRGPQPVAADRAAVG